MRSPLAHFAGKQPGVEDKRCSRTKRYLMVQMVSRASLASSAAAAPTLRALLGVCNPWCTHPPGCPEDSWLGMLLAVLSVSFNALSRHMAVFIPMFSHTSGATSECVSWQLELLWGFIELRRTYSKKIKVYMHPIEKDLEIHKWWIQWLQVKRAAKITSQAPTRNQIQTGCDTEGLCQYCKSAWEISTTLLQTHTLISLDF